MKTKMKLKTVEQVEERVQGLQMKVLVRIEKLDWSGARRLSRQIGDLFRMKVEIQKDDVKRLPLFSKTMEAE